MKIALISTVAALVVLVGGFYALNAYIYHEKQGEMPHADWTPVTTSAGVSFRYPESLGGTYFSAAEWPPMVEKVEEPYGCLEGETVAYGPLARIREYVIGTRTYCVSTASEGAAGSTYAASVYSTELNGAVVRVSVTLRFPQCGNYDKPEMDACSVEQAAFDVDTLVDEIVSTVTF